MRILTMTIKIDTSVNESISDRFVLLIIYRYIHPRQNDPAGTLSKMLQENRSFLAGTCRIIFTGMC